MLTYLQDDHGLAGQGWAWLGSSALGCTLAWLHTVGQAQGCSACLCAEAQAERVAAT